MSARFTRPSPALVVASLALVVALGGTAFAAPIRHFVASIDGGNIKNNTVTGKQVKESSLATVPRAGTVGGITVRKVFYAPKHKSATPDKILQLGGLVLTARCGNGDLDVEMTSTVDHAHLASVMYNSAGADGLHHSDFGPHEQIHVESLGDGNPYGETSFTYTRPNGTIVNG